MTLTVSLRIPDGIVLAADSLSTLQAVRQSRGNLTAKCPDCRQAITLKNVPIPQLPQVASFSPSAQKVFNLGNQVGVATFGTVFLGGRSVASRLREFAQDPVVKDRRKIAVVAEALADYFSKLVKKSLVKDAKVGPAPVIGFQIVGYDQSEENPQAYIIEIGREKKIAPVHDRGPCTVQGDTKVVRKLWNRQDGVGAPETIYQSFTLQDGIDYVRFLINTTSQFQRFAAVVPSVGGPVDVAVITPFTGFIWIKRKKLAEFLGD